MNRFFSNTFKVGLLACVSAAVSLSGTAQAQMVPEGGGMKQELADKGYNFRLYGKFRPKVTFSDAGDDNSIDVRQDSSRIGIQGKARINDNLTAVLRGEWRVQIGSSGADGQGNGPSELGRARLGFVGLESKSAGFLGIGQQWNPYYDTVGVPVDVLYNASNTPVGYNAVGSPFRTNNFIKYAHSVGAFKVGAGVQVDGSRGTSSSNNRAGRADGVDAFTVGAGFDIGKGYIGVAYWKQNMDGAGRFQSGFVQVTGNSATSLAVGVPIDPVETTTPATASAAQATVVTQPGFPVAINPDNINTAGGNDPTGMGVNGPVGTGDIEREFIGIAASFNINEDLYVSALYQDVSMENDAQSCVTFTVAGTDTEFCDSAADADPSALDIAAVYSFGDGMKLLAGAFTYDTDSGDDSRTKGMTLGLAKRLDKGMDVYVDWLRQDPDAGDATNQFNVGFRYSFDVGLL